MTNILSEMRPQIILLVLIYSIILGVIFLDLWAGIRKAKERGEYRSSFGYRKTVDKICKYFNMMFVISAIDAIQILAVYQLNEQVSYTLPLFPLFTFIGAIFICFIELKSVYESNSEKEKAKMNEAARLAGQILKNQDTQHIIGAFVEFLKTEKPKENEL